MLINDYISKCKVTVLNVIGEKMSDEEYFSIPAISNSKLKLLDPKEDGSPEKYKRGFQSTYNSSLLLGTAVHSQILTPNEVLLSDYEGKPAGKLGIFVEKVYYFRKSGHTLEKSFELASRAADYYNGKLTKSILRKAIKQGLDYYLRLCKGEFHDDTREVIVLPKAQLDVCKQCISAVLNNYQIHKLLSPNIFEDKIFMNEYAFFADFKVSLPNGKETTLKLKGKADSIIIDPETKTCYLNDVKTTSKPIGVFMDHIWEDHVVDGVFSHHRYEIQMTLYTLFLMWHLRKNMKLTDYTFKVNMWAVETCGEHKAECFPVSQAWLDLGKTELKELLVRVAFHELYGWDKNFEQSI